MGWERLRCFIRQSSEIETETETLPDKFCGHIFRKIKAKSFVYSSDNKEPLKKENGDQM